MAKIARQIVIMTAIAKINCRSMAAREVTYRITPTVVP